MSVTPKKCGLTIAGSDSGGGAGIQADLKAFIAAGVHVTTVLTCVTAQNPRGVRGVQAISPAMVRRQIDAVRAEFPIGAIKTGMLFSRPIIEAVCDSLQNIKAPLIVDPVMIATSGCELLNKSALKSLRNRLLPLATLVTPNVPELEVLSGMKISDPEDLRRGARIVHQAFGCAVLAKGGHLPGMKVAIDLFWDGQDELLLEAPFVKGLSTHGTGCTYSAAIAAYCCLNMFLKDALVAAKTFITQAIVNSVQCGEHWILAPEGRTLCLRNKNERLKL